MPPSIACVSCAFLSTLSLRRATPYSLSQSVKSLYFYPRSPCGERQLQGFLLAQGHNFYPRSPCGERLNSMTRTQRFCVYFYPRSPCGERRLEFCDTAPHIYFYPRSPCGERHPKNSSFAWQSTISIHALLAESDSRLDAEY